MRLIPIDIVYYSMSTDMLISRHVLQHLLNQIYNYDRDVFMTIEADILANRFILCFQCKSTYEKEITNVTCHWGNYTEHFAISRKTLFYPLIFLNHYIIELDGIYEPVLDVRLRICKIIKSRSLQLDPSFFKNRTMTAPLIFHSEYNMTSIKESIENLYKDWRSIRAQLINQIQDIVHE